LQQHDDAIADFTEAIRLHPKDLSWYMGGANWYATAGVRDTAMTDCTEAAKLLRDRRDPLQLRLRDLEVARPPGMAETGGAEKGRLEHELEQVEAGLKQTDELLEKLKE
jgi:hypothetical protein